MRLDPLLGLLRRNQLQALDEFKALAPRLRQRMDPASHAALCQHMAHLRFEDATQLLTALAQPMSA